MDDLVRTSRAGELESCLNEMEAFADLTENLVAALRSSSIAQEEEK